MTAVALLSNPASTGNRALLPRVRAFAAAHPDLFHYEVDSVDGIPAALGTIAQVRPRVLVVNGGDGTVQATLNALLHDRPFGAEPPPIAVLPNGKTNLIAHDLGAGGDPIAALERVIEMARGDLAGHVVARNLIAVDTGRAGVRPRLGMFLGAAGLAEAILFCRHRIYPLGLPNWLSHLLAAVAVTVGVLGIRARWLPGRARRLRVSIRRAGAIEGRFLVLTVTTLQRLLLGIRTGDDAAVGLRLLTIEDRPRTLLQSAIAAIRGRFGRDRIEGVRLVHGDEIRIDGDRPAVIMDGEWVQGSRTGGLVLRPTEPVDFLRLAA